MREIKFRAWNHDNKRMSQPFTLMDDINWYKDEAPCYDLMRFTGLLDRLCKEIYEWDIVKNTNEVFEVKFESGMFCLGDLEFPIWKANTKDYWEVIGNIYENSELLTPTQ